MSDSADTPGSPPDDSSSPPPTNVSPPPPAPKSSPPPKASPPPASPSPPPPASSPPPPKLSPPPPVSSPPPASPPPASSPPPSPLSPPPPSSVTPPASPPPASSPPPPSDNKTIAPPPKHAASPPPSPDSPVSPPSPSTGGGSPPPPSPSAFVPPPPSQLVEAPPPPGTQAFISPPPAPGHPHSGNSSSSSAEGKSSKVSNVPPAHASGGDGGDGRGSNSTATVVGLVLGGIVIIALIAIFFLIRSKKKRKSGVYPPHYLPPKSFTVQAVGSKVHLFKNSMKKDSVDGGYYYGQGQQQQHNSMGFSGSANYSYGSQVVPHSPHGDSYGSQRYTPPDGGLGGAKSFFTYEEVMEMTNAFSRQNIIGEGGFGCVYKGRTQDGKIVAVKQLKAGSGQGDREFKAEVEIISRVHHRHLVSLVGYSIAENQRLLIYEFVPNNTLEHHLHSKGLPVLDWSKRLKIALGSAKGLAYLHEDCHPIVIHRDIKSANILLDDDFEAQVADFGLARLNDTTQTHVSTRVMGTFGYLAPEYASSGKLTDRSDVFSFGVVLLELITGRKPVDPTQPLGDESLVEWARPALIRALDTGDLSELVDPRLQKHYVEREMLRMVETAAACVRHSAPKRPRMAQVVRSLDCEGEMSDLSNGVKYGQSTVYDSGQYNRDIAKFRKMALGGGESSEFDTFSGDFSSKDSGLRTSVPTSGEYTSGESETKAMTKNGSSNSHRRYGL